MLHEDGGLRGSGDGGDKGIMIAKRDSMLHWDKVIRVRFGIDVTTIASLVHLLIPLSRFGSAWM